MNRTIVAYSPKLLASLLAGSAIVCAAPAFAGEEVLYTPAPEWVDQAQMPDDLSGPPVVIFDDQRRIEEGLLATFIERVIRVDNPEMMQSIGTLQASWLPDKGDLSVHAVQILRDGAVIDVLADGAEFEILRRERMLESRMLDGAFTATMTVPGLRVGDALRVSYTVTTSDQALDKEVQVTAALPTKPFEANFARFIVSWPENSDVEWQVMGGLELDGPEVRDGYSTIEVALPLPESDEVPNDAPVRYRMPPMLQAGTFDGWEEVSAVMAPLYKTEGAISKDGPIAEQVAAIMGAHDRELERAVAALRVVQDEIAYQLNGMDGGNYIPQTPAQTWEMRFGDCKAKTLLLLAMLHEMGIEAEAVTVASQTGDVVPVMLPMPAAFDHVIVHATIDGKDYWLDGTTAGASMAVVDEVPPFVVALPIRDAGADLITMDQRPQSTYNMIANVRFDHSAGLDVPFLFNGEWVLTGPAASQVRGIIGQGSEEQIDGYIEQFSGQQIGTGMILESSAIYDEEANSATITASGLMNSPWQWERGEASRSFKLPSAGFAFRPDRSRKAWSDIPVVLPGPYSQKYKLTVLLPESEQAFEIDGKGDYSQEIANIRLERASSLAGNVLSVTDSASWPGGELAAENIRVERSKSSRFGSTVLELKAPGDIPRGFDATTAQKRERYAKIEQAYAQLIAGDPENIDYYRHRAWFRGTTLDREGAKEDIEMIVELDPAARSYLQRAAMHQVMGNLEAALFDAEEAYALNPSLEAAFTLSQILPDLGRVEDAIDLLEDQNGDGDERTAIALAMSDLEAMTDRKEAGMARIDEILDRRPGDPEILNAKCWYQGIWNYQTDQLDEICTKAVERADWSPPVLDSRAMGYFRLGRFDDALKDINAALSASPGQSQSLYLRGVIRLAQGDDGGQTDIGQAIAREPSLERAFARWGIGGPS